MPHLRVPSASVLSSHSASLRARVAFSREGHTCSYDARLGVFTKPSAQLARCTIQLWLFKSQSFFLQLSDISGGLSMKGLMQSILVLAAHQRFMAGAYMYQINKQSRKTDILEAKADDIAEEREGWRENPYIPDRKLDYRSLLRWGCNAVILGVLINLFIQVCYYSVRFHPDTWLLILSGTVMHIRFIRLEIRIQRYEWRLRKLTNKYFKAFDMLVKLGEMRALLEEKRKCELAVSCRNEGNCLDNEPSAQRSTAVSAGQQRRWQEQLRGKPKD